MITNEVAIKKPSLGTTSGTKIIQVFLDADCRFMLGGLIALCKKNKLFIEEMAVGQMIVFINTARNYIKLLACNGTPSPILACYRLPRGRIIDLAIVAEIPKAFKGGNLDYDEALRAAISKRFAKKRKVKNEEK